MSASLSAALEEGRLIRFDWSGRDEGGRQLLCLYTAFVGDPTSRPTSCPAELAPKWVAASMPAWDDMGTVEPWEGMVRRVAALAPKLGLLQGERSESLRLRCLAVVVREMLPRIVHGEWRVRASRLLSLLETGRLDEVQREWASHVWLEFTRAAEHDELIAQRTVKDAACAACYGPGAVSAIPISLSSRPRWCDPIIDQQLALIEKELSP